jgi:hypothetical protein
MDMTFDFLFYVCVHVIISMGGINMSEDDKMPYMKKQL